jgi:hypothetical protein
MIKYELTDVELNLADQIAHLRNDKKVAYNVRSKKMKKEYTEFETHYIGAKGEVLMARLLGLKLDMSSGLKGDGGTDLVFPNGLTIQIKVRTKVGWDYLLPTDSLYSFKTDIGVLVYTFPSDYPSEMSNVCYFAGWTSRTHFPTKARLLNLGYGKKLAISPKDMLPPKLLLQCSSNYHTNDDPKKDNIYV